MKNNCFREPVETLEETDSTINSSQLREGIGEILAPRFLFL